MGLGEISQTNDIIIPDPCFANDKTGSTYKPPPINCLPDPYLANDKIGSTSKPPPINCLARCRVQENNKHLSTASYPQKSLFFYQTTFCDVASVIWQVSCHFENRKYFLERKQPNLCRILKKFKEYFDNTTDCTLWPMNFFEKNDEPTKRLSHVLFKFSFWHFILVTLDFVLCVNLIIWKVCSNVHKIFHWQRQYRIVASTSPSRIEAHAGLSRLLMKGIFDPYVLWPFDKKLIF